MLVLTGIPSPICLNDLFLILIWMVTYLIYVTEEKLNVSWGLLCMWNFLATHFFFGSNHQATITSIRWESAYVGFVGDHTSYVIPFIMITLNTFGSLFISIFMSPLLLFRPFSSSWLYSIFKSKTPVNEQPDQKGEFFLKENGGMLRMAMIKLMLGCLLFYGCRVSTGIPHVTS